MNPLILTPRHATHADLPALHALIQRCYRGNASRAGWTHEADLVEGDRISHAELAAILDDPRETLLVAVSEGAVAPDESWVMLVPCRNSFLRFPSAALLRK